MEIVPEKLRRPKVAIVTSLVDFSPGYSLCGIILDQARMLKRAGYEYKLFCIRAFNKADKAAAEAEGLAVECSLAQCVLHEYKQNERPLPTQKNAEGEEIAGFEEQVEVYFAGDKTGLGYRDVLEPFDVVITHDLMYLDWHLTQNEAIRRCIELWPGKTWLHWAHSGPCERPDVNEENPSEDEMCYPTTLRFSAAPNSIYVTLNHGKVQDFANMLGADNSVVRVVTNPKDVRVVYGFQPETLDLIDRYDLLDHQILQTYAFSTPRWDAKGIRNLFCIWKHFKAMGLRARLVLVNCHGNSPCNKPQIEAMIAQAKKHGLRVGDDVVFTSQFGDEAAEKLAGEAKAEKDEAKRAALLARAKRYAGWKYCVPADVVRDLTFLGNLFVFPSETECCSLIQAEASLAGKYMVLNRDFAPMLEYCAPNVLHYEFTANDPNTRDGDGYHLCVARELWANMQNDAAVMNSTLAKTRTYNPDHIFRTQFEPLLYLKHPDRVAAEKRPEGKPNPVPEKRAPEPPPADPAKPDWSRPRDGMACPIYGVCQALQRQRCFDQAGHCPMADEDKA